MTKEEKERASELLDSFWDHLSNVTGEERRDLLKAAIAVLTDELTNPTF